MSAVSPAGNRPPERHWGFGMKVEKNAQGLFYVHSMVPGGPAESSGKIQVGDLITCIWRKKLHELRPGTSLDYVKRKLSGPPNTSCGLTLVRDGQRFRIDLTRKVFTMPGSAAPPSKASSKSELEEPELYEYLKDKLSRPKYPPQGAKGVVQGPKQGPDSLVMTPAQAAKLKAANPPPAKASAAPPKPEYVPPKPKTTPPKNATPQKKPHVGSGYPVNAPPRAAPNKLKGAQYYGVGLHIQRVPNGFQVLNLEPGGVAEATGGIDKGDVMVQIDGKEVKGLEFDEVRDLLLGPLGTKVTIGVIKQRASTSLAKNRAVHEVTFARMPNIKGAFQGAKNPAALKAAANAAAFAAAESAPPPAAGAQGEGKEAEAEAAELGGDGEESAQAAAAAGAPLVLPKPSGKPPPKPPPMPPKPLMTQKSQKKLEEAAEDFVAKARASLKHDEVFRGSLVATKQVKMQAQLEQQLADKKLAEELLKKEWEEEQKAEKERVEADRLMAEMLKKEEEDREAQQRRVESREEADRAMAEELARKEEEEESKRKEEEERRLAELRREEEERERRERENEKQEREEADRKMAEGLAKEEEERERERRAREQEEVKRRMKEAEAEKRGRAEEEAAKKKAEEEAARNRQEAAAGGGEGAGADLQAHLAAQLAAKHKAAQGDGEDWDSSSEDEEWTAEAGAAMKEAGAEEEELRRDVWYYYTDDESQLTYYFNPVTGETEWQLPEHADVRPGSTMEEAAGDGGGEEESAGAAWGAVEAVPEEEELGEGEDYVYDAEGKRMGGWLAVMDDEGNTYYYNEEAGESQWEHPAGLDGLGAAGEQEGVSDEDTWVDTSDEEASEGRSTTEKAKEGSAGAAEGGGRESEVNAESMGVWSMQSSGAGGSVAVEQELNDLKGFLSKLVLGNDFSGGTHGDSPALTVSLAITNLASASFGELNKLQPVSELVLAKWTKELDWLLHPLQQIVVLQPGVQRSADGTFVDVMERRLRDDIRLQLPKLRDVDRTLLAIHARFHPDDLAVAYKKSDSSEKKWWKQTPVIASPTSAHMSAGLVECAKAAMNAQKEAREVNQSVIASMPVPAPYLATLPENVKDVLGRAMAKSLKAKAAQSTSSYMRAWKVRDAMTAAAMIAKLQHASLIWGKKLEEEAAKAEAGGSSGISLRDARAEHQRGRVRCEELAKALRRLWPEAPQTPVEVAKIRENLDVGMAAMEALSRVLQGRAAVVVSLLSDACEAGKVPWPQD